MGLFGIFKKNREEAAITDENNVFADNTQVKSEEENKKKINTPTGKNITYR